MFLKSASVHSTASVDRSTLSTLSSLTRIRSTWSDHACIHKCSSAMKFLNWPLSWLPSQLFGDRSLALQLGCFCMALEMLLVHFCTNSLQGVWKLLSDLLMQRHQVCCGGHTFLLLRCATAAATAGLEGLQPAALTIALTLGPPPCHMEHCFGTRLEPRSARNASSNGLCRTLSFFGIKEFCPPFSCRRLVGIRVVDSKSLRARIGPAWRSSSLHTSVMVLSYRCLWCQGAV